MVQCLGLCHPMTLSQKEVRHIAWLARLAVTDEDVERFRTDLSAILEHFTVLQDLDTDGVPTAAHASLLDTVVRQDVSGASLSPVDVLANAPDQEDSLLKVPPILGLD